ncbi:FkbM family methyltransferase [Roseomonas sp. WA12]
MPIISYAQNGEDVVLWRALQHVGVGFYVDIGSCDPTELSVTKMFYDRGWSGINVEPAKAYFDRCVSERPRDLNLNIAVAAKAGVVRFLDVAGTGLSTTVQRNAEIAKSRGYAVTENIVPALSLAEILSSSEEKQIHFLKIDVEGDEQAVLEGADFKRFRPWIVVIEATLPNSRERSDAPWRDLLLKANYEQAYFDGVNLYFVAEEHRELKERLAIPPNALDNYQTAALVNASKHIDDLASTIASLETALSDAQAHGSSAEEALAWMRETQEHLESEAAARASRIVDLEAANASLETALSDARTHGASAEEALAWMRGTQERLESEVEARAARIAGLEAQIAGHEVELAREVAARTALQTEVFDERASLQREIRSRRNLQTRLAQQRSVIEEQRLTIEQEQLAKSKTQSQLEQALSRWNDLERLVDRTLGSTSNADQPLTDRLLHDWECRSRDLAAANASLLSMQRARQQLLTSKSWRVTGPLRSARRALQVRHMPSVVKEPVGKDLARRTFRLGVRTLLSLPGVRSGVRLIHRFVPSPLNWLAVRYRFYEGRKVQLLGPHTVVEEGGAEPSILPQLAAPLGVEPNERQVQEPEAALQVPEPPDMSLEEARLYRQALTLARNSSTTH